MRLDKYVVEGESKRLSVGLILTDGEIFLGALPTGRKEYDLPKGLKDSGESNIDAVIREVEEEVGVDISRYRSKLQPAGRFSYLPGKDLFVYVLKLDKLPSTSSMKCSSTFDLYDRQVPEIKAYKYFSFDDLTLFKREMIDIIEAVREMI